MSKWIRVEDRLPIEEGKVLIIFGEPFFGKCTPEIEAGYYDEESGNWRFWFPDREVEGFGVTHWMHLPEMPKTIKSDMKTIQAKKTEAINCE